MKITNYTEITTPRLGGLTMLILTRRVSETLNIGDDVKVTVLAVQGNQVRIGIDAPKDTAVHRQEIYLKIQQDKSAATTS